MASALLFCKQCREIIGEVPYSHVPFEFRCPRCKKFGRVYWYSRSRLMFTSHESMKYAHHLIAVPAKGRLGFMLKSKFKTYEKKEEESTLSSAAH